jgi:hypothetical protein
MLRQLIETARQRLLYNQLAAQFTFAVSLVLGALILLLLAGTQILDWRILAALVVCGAVFGLVRTLRSLPSHYHVAVLIDRRANLYDALSTAWIFEQGKGTSRPGPEIVATQRSQAEAMAHDVDLETALPFTMPRAAYSMAGLFLVATSLFALRYGISHNLDLKPPLTSVVMDALGWTPPAVAEKSKHPTESRMANLLRQLGISVPEPGEKVQASNLDPATDSALETIGDPDSDNSLAKNPPGSKSEEASVQGKTGDPSADPEDSAAGDESAPGKGNPEDAMGSQEGPQQGEQQAAKSGSAGESSSLLSKLKDALNNMMSKSKSQQASGGQKSSQSQTAQAQSGAQTSDKGQPGQGKQEGDKDSADASQDGQQQGDSEASQNSPGKGGGKSNDRDASAQPGSGIGRQDGSKDLRAAQQEKAMGKLSEVIGKRSANVTGEMTVEVQSGSQQLKTGYTQRTAQHAATGGDLSRDEVPLDLQPYVSGYFDEIRKQPPAKK